MYKKIIAIIVIVVISLLLLSVVLREEEIIRNKRPVVEILYPEFGADVSNLVMLRGSAFDPDGDDELLEVEVLVKDEWFPADGNAVWTYEWRAHEFEDGIYTIKVRSFDGIDYSEVEEIILKVDNPEIVDSDAHKWAIFISAANFPGDNESKLGNGALKLSEEMAAYFIENLGYSTSNIIILFDDGWIRAANGFGEPVETLQERDHKYGITYGSAKKENVLNEMKHIVEEANNFGDSEVFIWIASHGCGDNNNTLTGGKVLERSKIFLWDHTFSDKELGESLINLKSKKTCVIVDACFSGGFADRTIFNFHELFLLNSDIPRPGRVVITGTSKFRVGYASTTEGHLFSLLWFNGIKTGDADGFKSGILERGRPTRLRMYKDGKVSVEEAFYYAKYLLRAEDDLEEFSKMQPQINDQYPNKGVLSNIKGLILGE